MEVAAPWDRRSNQHEAQHFQNQYADHTALAAIAAVGTESGVTFRCPDCDTVFRDCPEMRRLWHAAIKHGAAPRLVLIEGETRIALALDLLVSQAVDVARRSAMRIFPGKVPSPNLTLNDAAYGNTKAFSDAVGRALFQPEGDYWTIAYRETVVRLKHCKGLAYLAQLLRDPNREFLALDLAISAHHGPANGSPLLATGDECNASEPTGCAFGDAGEMLDPQAKAAYRGRLAELEATVEEAKAFNDPERAASAQAEIDFLGQELARAVGLGGRDRKAASSAERARVNVTRTIKDAVRKITDHHPSLGRHLSATIKTGIFCAYIPDPHMPVTWQF